MKSNQLIAFDRFRVIVWTLIIATFLYGLHLRVTSWQVVTFHISKDNEDYGQRLAGAQLVSTAVCGFVAVVLFGAIMAWEQKMWETFERMVWSILKPRGNSREE